MDYGDVIRGLKEGRRFRRAGWNGKGMFIFLAPGSRFTVNREPLLSILGEGTEVDYHGHIDMYTAQGYIVPWVASQSDQLAEDWEEVVVESATKIRLCIVCGARQYDTTYGVTCPNGHGGADSVYAVDDGMRVRYTDEDEDKPLGFVD